MTIAAGTDLEPLIAGLESISDGQVAVRDVTIDHVRPGSRSRVVIHLSPPGAGSTWDLDDFSEVRARVRDLVSSSLLGDDARITSSDGDPSARMEVLLHERGSGDLIDDLPLLKRRKVWGATWGSSTRESVMSAPGEDRSITLAAFAAVRDDDARVLDDLGPIAGRAGEMSVLHKSTDRSSSSPRVVLVTGPGGRGQTRLLVEALSEFEHPQLPLMVLSEGMLNDPGIVDGLLHVSATIVIDDAHRDPETLRKLSACAGHVDGAQLVVTTRPSALESVRAALAKDLAPDRVRTIALGELDMRTARRLVDELSSDLPLSWSLLEYLATRAVGSPHVSVITVNLIRSGRPSGAPAVDASLRQRVLVRCSDVSAGTIRGCSPAAAHRVLAVHAAPGHADDDDMDLRGRMGHVSGIMERDLLVVRSALIDQGLLGSRAHSTQVVPEILANARREEEAVIGGVDTGFARELRTSFGGPHGHRLMLALADLDRRRSSPPAGRRDHPLDPSARPGTSHRAEAGCSAAGGPRSGTAEPLTRQDVPSAG